MWRIDYKNKNKYKKTAAKLQKEAHPTGPSMLYPLATTSFGWSHWKLITTMLITLSWTVKHCGYELMNRKRREKRRRKQLSYRQWADFSSPVTTKKMCSWLPRFPGGETGKYIYTALVLVTRCQRVVYTTLLVSPLMIKCPGCYECIYCRVPTLPAASPFTT